MAGTFLTATLSYLCYLMLTCTHSNDATHSSRYVPYSDFNHRGVWNKPPAATDLELYVYSVDPHETVNQAGNSKYANVVTRLAAVLRAQFDQGQGPAGE